jgi:hypothetical protein
VSRLRLALGLRPRRLAADGDGARPVTNGMPRLLLVLLATAALAAPAAARADGDRLAAALVKTAGVKSIGVDLSGSLTTQGQTIPLRASGALDARARAARFSLRVANPGGRASIDLAVVVVGRTLYLRFPLLTQLTGAKKPWAKLDLGKALSGQGAGLGSLLQANPAELTALACALSGATRNLGSATVKGVRTTHYRSRLDYRQALRCAPASLRAGLGRLAPQLGSAPVVPVDAYVDAQGYVRRATIDLSLRSGKKRLGAALTVDLSGFDRPVHVQAPPASQVASLKNLSLDLGRILPSGD